jgi:hypothetical protein
MKPPKVKPGKLRLAEAALRRFQNGARLPISKYISGKKIPC